LGLLVHVAVGDGVFEVATHCYMIYPETDLGGCQGRRPTGWAHMCIYRNDSGGTGQGTHPVTFDLLYRLDERPNWTMSRKLKKLNGSPGRLLEGAA